MLDTAQVPQECALQQDAAFFEALKYCGQRPVLLPCGLTLLTRRFLGVRVGMLPRATPPPDLAVQMAGIGMGRCPLILSPETPVFDLKGALNARQIRPAMTLAQIDLTPDVATRRARLHSKWRNQLCRAEEGPLKVRSAPLSHNDPILMKEQAQSRARKYANWPLALTSAFARVAPDQTRLFTAYRSGQPLAQMLFLRHGSRATYHIGQTTPEGRRLNAHNLLLWTAANWLAKSGHTALDLGTLHAETPSLNRFKLRAGAVAQATGGTWLRWRPLRG